jgi:hypothetical protein
MVFSLGGLIGERLLWAVGAEENKTSSDEVWGAVYFRFAKTPFSAFQKRHEVFAII